MPSKPTKSLDSNTLEFIVAIEKYKKKHDKLFLAWSEVMEIMKDLGYRKEPSGQ
jgi:hypothetical protein